MYFKILYSVNSLVRRHDYLQCTKICLLSCKSRGTVHQGCDELPAANRPPPQISKTFFWRFEKIGFHFFFAERPYKSLKAPAVSNPG